MYIHTIVRYNTTENRENMERRKKIIILICINKFFEPLSYLDDEDEDLLIENICTKSQKVNRKIKGYVEHRIPSFCSEHFKSHFR